MFWVSWGNTIVFSLIVTLKILLTLNVWVIFTPTTPLPILQTPSGCPTVQFNSDIKYPELVSDSTDLKA